MLTALAPWFGSNRLLAPIVAQELSGCRWVGVPFAGGMAEVLAIEAPTIVVSDLHRNVINLARVVADAELGPKLYRRVRRLVFHPETLAAAQDFARTNEPGDSPDLAAAVAYFTCCWMGRSGRAGTDAEFSGS